MRTVASAIIVAITKITKIIHDDTRVSSYPVESLERPGRGWLDSTRNLCARPDSRESRESRGFRGARGSNDPKKKGPNPARKGQTDGDGRRTAKSLAVSGRRAFTPTNYDSRRCYVPFALFALPPPPFSRGTARLVSVSSRRAPVTA